MRVRRAVQETLVAETLQEERECMAALREAKEGHDQVDCETTRNVASLASCSCLLSLQVRKGP